ncbi:MAG: hypothetical protein E6G67_03860 [Actinobacteria bacterium]|nr:MAG: hypothetical protein E6G67_03860 [Actinomycetota bacterium]
MIFIVIGIVAGVGAALGFSPLVGVVIFVGIVVVGWGLTLTVLRGPGDVARRRPKQELLGPGGSDDPER